MKGRNKERTDDQREKDREKKRALRGSVGTIASPNTGDKNFKRDEDGKPIEKRCTVCDSWKSISEFQKRKDTPSGVVHRCKSCLNKSVSIKGKRKREARRQDPSLNIKKSCIVCGSEFTTRTRATRCSDECRAKESRDKQRITANSIHTASHAKCRRCGETKQLASFSKKGQTLGCLPTCCNECSHKNKSKHRRLARNRPGAKPVHNLRKRFKGKMSITRKGGSNRFSGIMGCSTAFLRKHLEAQFTKGMRWANYGSKWHVDHILPVSSFDHSDPDQVRKCWHYSNLRPLCAIENNIKSDTIIECQPELLLSLGR